VRLVPPGHEGVTRIGVGMGVRSLSEHRKFYGKILGFAEEPSSTGYVTAADTDKHYVHIRNSHKVYYGIFISTIRSDV